MSLAFVFRLWGLVVVLLGLHSEKGAGGGAKTDCAALCLESYMMNRFRLAYSSLFPSHHLLQTRLFLRHTYPRKNKESPGCNMLPGT